MRWGPIAFGVVWALLGDANVSSAGESETEAAALRERAKTGSIEAIEALVPLLDDPNSKVRYQAEWGLAEAGGSAVPALIGELRRRRDDAGRAQVARLLGRVGLYAEAAIPDLRAALSEPDSSTAGAASYALGVVKAREAVPDLVAAYTTSRKIPNQRKMAEALRRIGSDQGVRTARAGLAESVQASLGSDDASLRAKTVHYTWALYRALRKDEAGDFPTRSQLRGLVPGLVDSLDDPDPKVAEQAVKALTLAGRDAADAVPDLERLIGHPQLHHVAMKALQAFGSAEAKRVIAERLALEQLEKRIRTDYSLQDHQGRTQLLIFRVAGKAADGLRMSARFLYPGRVPSLPSHVVVHLESTSPERRFAEVRELTWFADGTPIRMEDIDRSFSHSQIGGVIEQLSARLPVASFLAIANARRLGARIGALEFELSDEDRAAMRHFATRMGPADMPNSRQTDQE